MQDTQGDILLFYGWWQMSVCLFAFLALMSIWYHLGRKQEDTGQVWLAVSILCWSLSGLLDIVASTTADTYVVNGGKSILSLFNSFFILLALPWFRYLPQRMDSLIRSKSWILIIGAPLVLSLLPTLTKLILSDSSQWIAEPDVYYSILTLLILGWVLWETFTKRRLHFLAYLSVICIGITFVAQVYKLSDNAFSQLLCASIFKTCLIMIFFALALSWVKDMAEKLDGKLSSVRLNLKKIKDDNSKWVHTVTMTGLFEQPQPIALSKTHYDLLHRFVQRKQDGEGWLEIKPKNDSRTGKVYDINHYNEVKRVIHAILDGQYGKNNWSKDLHELPLKELLFERSSHRERKIRLTLPANQLQIKS